jgi:hypothetical protein
MGKWQKIQEVTLKKSMYGSDEDEYQNVLEKHGVSRAKHFEHPEGGGPVIYHREGGRENRFHLVVHRIWDQDGYPGHGFLSVFDGGKKVAEHTVSNAKTLDKALTKYR